jgi:ankyrin repeat protein
MAAFLCAAENGHLQVVQYLLSSEGGASMTEIDDQGSTALLLAAGDCCLPSMVQWILEYEGAQFTDINNENSSVWSVTGYDGLSALLKCA